MRTHTKAHIHTHCKNRKKEKLRIREGINNKNINKHTLFYQSCWMHATEMGEKTGYFSFTSSKCFVCFCSSCFALNGFVCVSFFQCDHFLSFEWKRQFWYSNSTHNEYTLAHTQKHNELHPYSHICYIVMDARFKSQTTKRNNGKCN